MVLPAEMLGWGKGLGTTKRKGDVDKRRQEEREEGGRKDGL